MIVRRSVPALGTDAARDARRTNAARLARAAAVLVAVMGIASCGGRPPRAHVEFVRSADEPRPLWVAVYFLDRESILDGESTSDLIAKKDEFRQKPGVIDAYAFPVAPDGSERIQLDPLDPAIRWVVLAAESDSQDECVRQKIEVREEKDLTLLVEAQGDCLKVKRGK